MIALVALWAFAEGILFFIVADVPISAIGLRQGFRPAVRAAAAAALAAACGGLVTLAFASAWPIETRAIIEHVPGISVALFDRAPAAYADGGVGAMAMGSFQGIPYKLYAYAAGADGTTPALFVLYSIAARLPRFVLVAAASSAIAPMLRQRLTAGQMWLAFVAFWMLFYAVYFAAMA